MSSTAVHRAINRRWIPVADLVGRQDLSPPHPPHHHTFTFSLCSYNVLAQSLIDRRKSLHYASVFAGRWKHRRLNLINEIRELDSDVLSMQEVDHYDDFWKRELEQLGYASVFESKPDKPYGLMTAWKRHKFELVDSRVVQYKKIASGLQGLAYYEVNKSNIALLCALRIKQQQQQQHGILQTVDGNHQHHRTVHHNVVEGGNGGTAAAADGTGDSLLLLANTHLYFRQSYNYTKLLQLILLLQETVDMRAALYRKHPGSQTLTMATGDFNFTPAHVLYKFLTSSPRMDCSKEMDIFLMPEDVLLNTNISFQGKPIVDASHAGQCSREMSDSDAALVQQRLFSEGHEERPQRVRKLLQRAEHLPYFRSCLADYCNVDKSARQRSMYYPASSEIPFTAFTEEFTGVSDYIMTAKDGGLQAQVTAMLSIPDMELLTMQTALPNEVLGSDHICIGVQLGITPNRTHSSQAVNS